MDIGRLDHGEKVRIRVGIRVRIMVRILWSSLFFSVVMVRVLAFFA